MMIMVTLQVNVEAVISQRRHLKLLLLRLDHRDSDAHGRWTTQSVDAGVPVGGGRGGRGGGGVAGDTVHAGAGDLTMKRFLSRLDSTSGAGLGAGKYFIVEMSKINE